MGQESHVLERWKPSSCIKPGLSMKREGHDNWNLLTIPIECLAFYSSRGYVLFLTEKHRWTEHTAFHRDIKSTDFTEPYSHRKPHPQPLSIRRGAGGEASWDLYWGHLPSVQKKYPNITWKGAGNGKNVYLCSLNKLISYEQTIIIGCHLAVPLDAICTWHGWVGAYKPDE